ncbi:MAG: hypothetical protein IIB06_06630 [Bacteroidetes bacterium]|nr:hypothetical protein [Bacteroidota bacterium]
MGVNKCGVGGVALLSVVHGSGGGGAPVAPDPIPNSANESFTLDFSNHPEGIYYIYDIFSNIIY